jgi:hypothetical protein
MRLACDGIGRGLVEAYSAGCCLGVIWDLEVEDASCRHSPEWQVWLASVVALPCSLTVENVGNNQTALTRKLTTVVFSILNTTN